MDKNSFKKYRIKGFTIIELLLAMSLIGIIILISTNLSIFGIKTHKITLDQYDIQSAVRITSEKLNNIVRYSKGVFAVPEKYVENTNVMDPTWNYIMLSENGKKIVDMKYNEVDNKFKENILVDEQAGISYRLIFEKEKNISNRILKYSIYAYVTDNDGKLSREELVFQSSIDAINTIQVVDKGSPLEPSIALAYREEGKTGKDSKTDGVAYVTLIIDVSGSMNYEPDGKNYNSENSRIKLLKKTLTQNNGIIDKFSKEENLYLSIIPFSVTANYPTHDSIVVSNEIRPIYFPKNDNENIKKYINGLRVNHQTNTGDGLRRAYYLHKNFDLSQYSISTNTNIKNHIILLIDGESNQATIQSAYEDNGWYNSKINFQRHVTEIINGESYFRFDWKNDWRILDSNNKDFYLNDKNVGIEDNRIERTNYYNGKIRISKSENFSTGNIVTYGEKNENKIGTGVTGNKKIAEEYIKKIGNMINGNISGYPKIDIKSYIIGYAKNDKDDITEEIKNIGKAIGTLPENIYDYNNTDFDLDQTFANISDDILADLWLITGPKIMN